MKIAIGIYRLHPRGGLEDHAVRIAQDLIRRGHDVTLFTTDRSVDVAVPIVSLGHSLKRLTNHGRMGAFAADFGNVTRGNFDRVVGFQPMPGLDVLFLADHIRNRPDAPLLKRLLPRFRDYARLEASCFRAGSATRIVGLARPQMEAFVGRYPQAASRITILPPTISEARRKPQLRTPERRAEMRARLRIDQRAPVWLWLGLQPHVKGLDRVVAALAHSSEAILLVGGIARGDHRIAELLRQADQSDAAGRMRWLGYLAGDDLLSHLAAADVLAHPARTDVTGATILEAVINGLPVVATDGCGFAPHVEASGAGLLVSSIFEPSQFVTALKRVCGPENETFSRNGVAYGKSPYLYSGLSVACDLIEAPAWPEQVTMAADRNGRPRPGTAPEGSPAWSP